MTANLPPHGMRNYHEWNAEREALADALASQAHCLCETARHGGLVLSIDSLGSVNGMGRSAPIVDVRLARIVKP